MNQQKVYSLIGFARKAGKLTLGTEAVEGAIFRHKAKLVIIDDGASRNTKKRFLGACEEENIPAMGLPAGMLSDILKWERVLLGAVTDEGFASAINQAIRAKALTEETSVNKTNE